MKVEHLVKKFIPENYNLFLDLNRETKSFFGNVAVSGEALDNQIAFHQKGLSIESVKLDNGSLEFSVDNDNETFSVDLPETGVMTIVIEFSGKITDNMTGIYPSYYTENGVKKEVVSTQFESHFAREAFPCIDEPEAKATFDLSLKFDQGENEIALSNMPESNPELRKETGVWSFETTPRMSSYLLAFGFGDLQGKTRKTKNGTQVGVFSTKAHQLESLDFALDIAVRVIDFYEDYFGVRYPIPQSYHLALPDFSAGAMENWGLVTYREVYLVVDKNSTVSSRQQVALVIAHEIAHQWFGNLVTMKWWDDLWLNESFANMMEYVAIDAIEPSWHIFDDFQTSGVPLALERDATDGVQSVHVEVNHPDEINTLFDPAIVYAKGSRLMHMLRRWLGDSSFVKGLGIYFKKYQYKNTVGYDLWHALSEASGKDVASFMNSWLEQPGYPLLTARVVDNQLILSQKQFYISKGEDKGRLWEIPLNTNWKGLPDILSEESVVIPNYSQLASQNEGALRFNTANTAHYITDYQGELLDSLLSELNHLDSISQLQVLQERRLLAKSGIISYASLLPIIDSLKQSSSYMVVSAISQVLAALDLFVDEGSEEEKSYRKLVKKVHHYNWKRLGILADEKESDEDELIRQVMLLDLVKVDDSEVRTKANHIFQQYAEDLSKIPAAIRLAILVSQYKNEESEGLLDSYIDYYEHTNDGNFKRQLARAISYTKSDKNLEKIIDLFKNKDVIKPQDLSMSWYYPLLHNSYTQMKVWNWAKDNWEWIKATLGGDMSFDKFVIYPADCFKTFDDLEEYKNFFLPQIDDLAISRNISMGIKAIEARIVLIESEKDKVSKALLEFV